MRVLLATETFNSGVGRHILLLIKHFTKNGLHVDLVFSSQRTDNALLANARDAGAVIHEIPMNREVGFKDASAVLALRRLAAAHGPFDIVHGHSSKAGGVVRIARIKGARTVYSPHAFRTMDPELSMPSRAVYSSIEWLLGAGLSDAVVVTSQKEQEHARRLSIPERRLQYIVNASDIPSFRERGEARRRLGLTDEQICLCFASRWSHQKDPGLFLRLCEALHARNKNVIGAAVLLDPIEDDDECMPLLRDVVAKGAVKVVNARAVDVLTGADVFVLTSRYEGMPYILIEAAMAGLPIVSCDVGGAHETVEDGVNGFIIDRSRLPGEFIEKTQKLTNDATLRAQFSRASLELSKRFLPENMGRAYVEMYERLRGGAPAAKFSGVSRKESTGNVSS